MKKMCLLSMLSCFDSKMYVGILFIIIKITIECRPIIQTTNFSKLSSCIAMFDFHKLACLEPALRPFVLILNDRTVCNFKNQESLVILNKVIMKRCFNLLW